MKTQIVLACLMLAMTALAFVPASDAIYAGGNACNGNVDVSCTCQPGQANCGIGECGVYTDIDGGADPNPHGACIVG
jgi:hypothetical protein